MNSPSVENLLARGLLERRSVDVAEVRYHVRTARDLLAVASREAIPEAARFINLYEAAHAVALAGLKVLGYRGKDGEGGRSVVLQLVEETLAVRKGSAAAFAHANRIRNNMLYVGSAEDVPEYLLELLPKAIGDAIEEIEHRIRQFG